jgi:DNA-binding CsgD family transcriptional regulator
MSLATTGAAAGQAGGLLERERELADVQVLLDVARSHHGGMLVFEAPAGMGKTRLLQRSCELARDRSMATLRAVGSELERDVPFGMVRQLFEARLAGASHREREELLAGAAALAGRLLQGRAMESGGGSAEAFPLYHGLFWLTSNLAERSPLLIAVDDAHWADRPSVEFLVYLVQRLQDLPSALVIAMRPGEPGPARALLAQLASHPLARVLHPAPLSWAAVQGLVCARLPGAEKDFARACADATKGNPFLLHGLLAALKAEGVEPTQAAAGRIEEFAPESVTRAVLARLARLSTEAEALARAVAVLGNGAALRHAAALAGLDNDQAARQADALAAMEILEGGEPLAFVHPLIRSSVYASVPGCERARMHLHAARLLADESGTPEKTSLHLLRCPPTRDRWVVETLGRAANRALADGAPGLAVEDLRRALTEPPTPEGRAEVLVGLGRAEVVAGERRAPERFEQALELVEEPHERAHILLALGGAYYGNGRLSEAAEALDRGLADLRGEDQELAAELQAAWITVARLDPSMRAEALKRTAPLLERPPAGETRGERVLLAHAAEQLVAAGDRRQEAIALARRALRDGALVQEERSEGIAWVAALGALGWSDDFEGFGQAVEAALADARRRGSVRRFAEASYGHSFLSYYSGWLAEAVADLQPAVDPERYGDGPFLSAACGQLAWAQLERGELERAAAALARVDADPRWSKTSMHALVLEARARLRLIQGRSREALDDALAAGLILREAQVENPSPVPWRSRAALAAAKLGALEQARQLVGEEIELARRFGAPRPIGVALRAAGLIEGGAAGIELLGEAASVLEHSPAALEYARALIDLGAAVRRHGRRSAAREPLRRGLDMAHRFGAVLLEQQARNELLAAGARPRRTALRGIEALTPSERRVSEMAAEGLTNREIAQALFVTLRTVEAHLSRAYDKLGIRTRAELGDYFGETRKQAQRLTRRNP